MKKVLYFLLFLILLCFLAFPLYSNIQSTKFHTDETYWLLASKQFKLFLYDESSIWTVGDAGDVGWNMMLLYDHPPVAKLLFIKTAEFLGEKIEDIDLEFWDFSKDEQYNLQRKVIPSIEILLPYRYAAAFFGLMTCLLVFMIGTKISNTYTGIIAATIMAYNPLMIRCSTRVMADTFLLFFICATAYTMIMYYESLRNRRYIKSLLISVIIGIVAAIATGTKLNGIVAYMLFTTFCLLCFIVRFLVNLHINSFSISKILTDKYIRTIVCSAFIFAILAALVFVIINPFLWFNPIQNLKFMLAYRLKTTQGQAIAFNAGLYSIVDRLIYIWGVALSPQGSASLLHNRFNLPLYFILFLFGLFQMVKDEIIYIFNSRLFSSRTIILLWFLVTLGFLSGFLLLSWDRHLLPFLPPVALLIGYSLGNLYQNSLITKA